MFRVVFSCKKRNVCSLFDAISKYCISKGFDNYLLSEYEFTKLSGVGVRIALSQHKYKLLCPDDIRDELIYLVTKNFKSSHLLCYVIKDTNLLNEI